MLCRELARAVGEQGGGAVYAKRACWPPTERNGTFSLEPAVASVGTGRKCAFGATTGICVKSVQKPRESAQTRSKRDPEHSRWQQQQHAQGGVGAGDRVERVTALVLRARRGDGVLLPAEAGRAASLDHDIVNHVKNNRTFAGEDKNVPEADPVGAHVQNPLWGAKQHHLSQRSLAVSPISLRSTRLGGSDRVSEKF